MALKSRDEKYVYFCKDGVRQGSIHHKQNFNKKTLVNLFTKQLRKFGN